MNDALKKADEIVMALRWLAKETGFIFAAENLNGAADLIKSLQAQHEQAALNYQQKCRDVTELEAQLAKLENRIAAEGFPDLETMISKYKTVMLAANEISIETDEEIEALKAKLTTSQRREKAAVEFFAKLLLLCDVAPKDRAKVFRNFNAGPGDYLGTGFVFVDAFNQFIEEFYDTADAELYESVMDEVERRRGPQAEKGEAECDKK